MNSIVLFGSIIYALIGIILCGIAYFLFDRVAARLKVTEIIVRDKNIGLGIVIAGIFVSIAIIIAAAIK